MLTKAFAYDKRSSLSMRKELKQRFKYLKLYDKKVKNEDITNNKTISEK